MLAVENWEKKQKKKKSIQALSVKLFSIICAIFFTTYPLFNDIPGTFLYSYISHIIFSSYLGLSITWVVFNFSLLWTRQVSLLSNPSSHLPNCSVFESTEPHSLHPNIELIKEEEWFLLGFTRTKKLKCLCFCFPNYSHAPGNREWEERISGPKDSRHCFPF